MFLLILGTVVVCLLAWLWAQRRMRSFWADRGVPHLPPHLLLGNFDFIFRKNVGVWMRELHEKFSAPFVGIWVFRQPVLVVADPAVAKRILLSDSDLFRNRYLASGKTDPIGGLNIFTVKEPTWSNVRRRLTYVFTAAKLKMLHGLISSKAKATIDRIRQDKENNRTTEMRSVFADFSTDIIGTFAFGFENNAIVTGDSPLRAVTRDFMNFDWFRGLSWYSIFFWPALVDIFRFSLFPKKSVEFFRKTLSKVIEQRTSSQIEKNDLLDALMKMKQGLAEVKEFSDDLLAAQAVIMLQGGFDTTAVVTTFILYELAYKPEIQEKLYKELIQAKEDNDGVDFNFADLEKLVYLNCVMKEAMRRYVPMGWLDRIAAVDYAITDSLTLPAGTPVYINAMGLHHEPRHFPAPYDFRPERFLPEHERNIAPCTYLPFGDGPRMCIDYAISGSLTLPAGTPVYINAMGLHHDPRHFPAPYDFRPERFLPERKRSIAPCTYLPFGDGPRMCIGKRFAQMSIRYLLAELVLNLQFRPLPGHPRPVDVEFEKKSMFLMPGTPLYVEFILRI